MGPRRTVHPESLGRGRPRQHQSERRWVWLAARAAAAAGVALALVGCRPVEPPPPKVPAAPPSVQRPDFDGERALRELRALTATGQRWQGAPGRAQALQGLERRLTALAGGAQRQTVPGRHPDTGVAVELTNLVARVHPQRPARVLLGTHWDTRAWAELDPDPTRRDSPIPGANDGASGIAVLFEVARQLRLQPLRRLGVDLVLFDGEELGRVEPRLYCQGSRGFASRLPTLYPAHPLEAALVLDMVGDADLGLLPERLAQQRAPGLVELVWSTAAALGEPAFRRGSTVRILDDHTPLLQAGVPAVLLIDWDYPPFHTHADTPERCSAASLASVGRVVLASLRRLDAEGPLPPPPPRPRSSEGCQP